MESFYPGEVFRNRTSGHHRRKRMVLLKKSLYLLKEFTYWISSFKNIDAVIRLAEVT